MSTKYDKYASASEMLDETNADYLIVGIPWHEGASRFYWRKTEEEAIAFAEEQATRRPGEQVFIFKKASSVAAKPPLEWSTF